MMRMAGVLALTMVVSAAPGSSASLGPGGEKVLSWQAVAVPATVAAGGQAELRIEVTLHGEWHINGARPRDEALIATRLRLEPVEGLVVGEPIYPEPVERRFEFAEDPLLVYAGSFTVRVPVAAAAAAAGGARTIQGRLRYQACDDRRCLPPREEAIVAGLEVAAGPATAVAPGSVDAAGTAAATPAGTEPAPPASGSETAIDGAGAGGREAGARPMIEPAAPSADEGLISSARVTRLFEEGGYGVAFGLIFLIGLALNLTPCVYPVIPITLGYFANQSDQRTRRTFLLALVYVLGMAMMYSALGAVAAVSGKAFGSALASPWVLWFEAAVMVALALSMFGVWEIGVPGWLSQRLASSPSGVAGAAFMGLTVGIVAAPCLGPAILGLFVFVAQSGSLPLGLAVFFVLALGMGAPFLLLAVASGNISRLPRSGEWMVWIKHLFGFLLLAMAFYFLRPIVGDTVFAWAIPLLCLAAGIFLGFIDPVGSRVVAFRRLKAVVGSLLLVLAGLSWSWLRAAPAELAWTAYEPASFARVVGQGRPVLVDFTAEWCLPCKELERFTFADPKVARETERFHLFRADGTVGGDPAIEELQTRFAVLGYPTILFIDSKGAERADLRVVGFVDAAEFRQRLEQVD